MVKHGCGVELVNNFYQPSIDTSTGLAKGGGRVITSLHCRLRSTVACAVLLVLLAGTVSCARLHHAQVGEIDSSAVLEGNRFEIIISESGLNLDDAAEVAKLFAGSQSKEVDTIRDIIKLFQMGPSTGNPVFEEQYADVLFDVLNAECPDGQITGLVSIRESADYPVVSGEIIKLVGYCKEGR